MCTMAAGEVLRQAPPNGGVQGGAPLIGGQVALHGAVGVVTRHLDGEGGHGRETLLHCRGGGRGGGGTVAGVNP